MPFWFVAEISSPIWGSISAQNLVSALALYLFSATKRDQHTPTVERKKNVTMDKMKVNKQQTMKEKGNSSSSHYRNNGLNEVATKFVTWETNPLESLTESKVYRLRVKLNKGGLMTRDEKNWLAEAVNSNCYFRTAVPLMGYRFDFFDILKKYLVNQYGQWAEYYAPDRTSLKNYLVGQVSQIVEIPKQ